MTIKKSIYNKYFYLALVLGIMTFIFIQSALPADLSDRESGLIVSLLADFLNKDAEVLTFYVRKFAHFSEYTALGISLILTVSAWRQDGGLVPRPAAALIYGALYAISDEIHQAFVPGRSCEFRDMLIDIAGVLTGIIIISICKKHNKDN